MSGASDEPTAEDTEREALARVGAQLEQGVRRLATGIAESFGAKADVVFSFDNPATVNDPEATTLTRRAATAVAGEARVVPMAKPTMGGEDFSFMLNAKQGSYIMLGGARGTDDAMVHHPRYDFNDEILPVGASYWATLAEQLLPRTGERLRRSISVAAAGPSSNTSVAGSGTTERLKP